MMASEFEVETKLEAGADARGLHAPRSWASRVVCLPILAVAGACLVLAFFLTSTSSGQAVAHATAVDGSDGSHNDNGDDDHRSAADKLHDIYHEHKDDIDKWNENVEDPCILARYMCLEMENAEQCSNVGSYCRWVVNPASHEGTCIKADRDSNDFCAVHQTMEGCSQKEQREYGCVWKEVPEDIFAPGGYCIEGKDAQSGCNANIVQATCDLRDECEWLPDSQSERRLQVPQLPGTGKFPGTSGHCLKKESKDGCCTSLGPTEGTCEKVSGVCEWNAETKKCQSNGRAGSVRDDVDREVEEICHYQPEREDCDQKDYMCVWDEDAHECKAKEKPPPLEPTEEPVFG